MRPSFSKCFLERILIAAFFLGLFQGIDLNAMDCRSALLEVDRTSISPGFLADLRIQSRRGIHSNKVFLAQRFLTGRDFSNLSNMTWQKFRFESAQLSLGESSWTMDGKTEVNEIESIYSYPLPKSDEIHFHVNFADPHLFSFWHSALFAQDEVQVAEHPLVGFWQTLLANQNSNIIHLEPRSHEIALLSHIPRLGQIDTRTIYGNNFARASQALLMNLALPLFPATQSHWLAMPAKAVDRWSSGSFYQEDDIRYHFIVSFTAFAAAKKSSVNSKVIIHTGNWGTGAFGNDPVLIALLQIAAAHFAHINQLFYYTVSAEYSLKLREALRLFEQYRSEAKSKTILEFIAFVKAQKFRYGVGNGT